MAVQLYVARVTANALAAGRFVALVAGEPVELSPAEADELLRIRFVARVTRSTQMAGDTGDSAADDTEVKTAGVETAAIAPADTATAPAQHARAKKGSAA